MKTNKNVIMKKHDKPMIIKGTIKVPIGHQNHITGTGIHDNRPKRQRTRKAKMIQAIKEWAKVIPK